MKGPSHRAQLRPVALETQQTVGSMLLNSNIGGICQVIYMCQIPAASWWHYAYN